MDEEIRKLMAERDHWRALYERAAGQRAHLLRFLGDLAEAAAEGNYVSIAEIEGGPVVNVTARYSSLYAALRVSSHLQTLRRMFRFDRQAAAGLREMKIHIDPSR
jgi:hypothetical protein